mgnify:FL=1
MSSLDEAAPVRYRYQPPSAAEAASPWLQVAGVGLGVEYMRAETLWSQLEARAGHLAAPDAPAGSVRACQERAHLFRGAALRRALSHYSPDHTELKEFVENYPIPGYFIGPSKEPQLDFQKWMDAYNERVSFARDKVAHMPYHRVDGPTSHFSSNVHAAQAWSEIFQRFDSAGDLNSMLLFAEDGYAIRSQFGYWRNKEGETLAQILSRPKTPVDLSESVAGVLLLRPQSTNWLQELAPHTIDSQKLTVTTNGLRLRGPHGFGGFHGDGHRVGITTYRSPENYTTTSNVPLPWSEWQMNQYLGMPVYGWLHRPEIARFTGDSKALLPMEERLGGPRRALPQAVQQAFEGAAPERVFFAVGTNAQAPVRTSLLQRAAAEVLPQLQLYDPKVGYDLSHRLGEMGAASGAVAVGLAAVAGWVTGGTALVVDFRDDGAASVLAFKPSSQAYRNQFVKPPYEDV